LQSRRAVAVLDEASARALGVDFGKIFPVRKADGEDLDLTVVGIIERLELRNAPPRTVEAPALTQDSELCAPPTKPIGGPIFQQAL